MQSNVGNFQAEEIFNVQPNQNNEHDKKQYKHFSLTVTSELVGKKCGD